MYRYDWLCAALISSERRDEDIGGFQELALRRHPSAIPPKEK